MQDSLQSGSGLASTVGHLFSFRLLDLPKTGCQLICFKTLPSNLAPFAFLTPVIAFWAELFPSLHIHNPMRWILYTHFSCGLDKWNNVPKMTWPMSGKPKSLPLNPWPPGWLCISVRFSPSLHKSSRSNLDLNSSIKSLLNTLVQWIIHSNDKNSYHLLSAYYVPGLLLSSFI